MKRTMVFSFLAAGTLCLQPALAQAPAGGAGAPSSQQTSPSAQRPSSMGQQPGTAGVDTTAGSTSSSKMDDKKFVKDAAVGGMAEVELGKLAVQKASRDDVKQFGQKMIDDHTKANDQLKEVASKESIDVPASLDSKHQAKLDKLSKLSGPDFDKAYVKDMLKDHQTDVHEFNTEAQNGTDPNIKAFASATLPTLQEHLEMVKNLSKSGKTAKQSAGGQ